MRTSISQVLKGLGTRSYSTQISPSHVAALDQWIASRKKLIIHDTIRSEHLSNLYITLPTRDGTQKPFKPPVDGSPLEHGHHLVLFPPRVPEPLLRSDGTDGDFCPPEPFTRRMWAGGEIEWKKPLLIGDKATSVSTLESVEKKGFDSENGKPMLFVSQKMQYFKAGSDDAAIEETRSHVYLTSLGKWRGPREVPGLPKPDFEFSYLPTAITLFRFSALMFNAHYIHLEKEYAEAEGYPERLVHGPLTALMLLEVAKLSKPELAIKRFRYRARNPLVANRAVTIQGAWAENNCVKVWAKDENGVVGMLGTIIYE